MFSLPRTVIINKKKQLQNKKTHTHSEKYIKKKRKKFVSLISDSNEPITGVIVYRLVIVFLGCKFTMAPITSHI